MENKREKLMNPDEYIDLDQRTFTQQMADINVEVVRMAKKDQDAISSEVREAQRMIKEAGMEGRISPGMVIQNSKEEIEDLTSKGMNSDEIAESLGISAGTLSSLRSVYGITGRSKRRVKQPEKPAEKKAATNINDIYVAEKAEEIWLKANPGLFEKGATITRKTIRTTAQAAGGEVLGTAKMLEKLGELQVVVEIRVMEGA